MQSERTPFWVYLCAVGFALIVGLISFVSKVVAPFAVPFLLVALRFLVSIVCNYGGQKIGVFHCSFKGKPYKGLLVVSGLVYAGSYLTQILGLMYSPSILCGVMIATTPIWCDILAVLILREKPTLMQALLILTSACALIFMLVMGNTSAVTGFTLKGTLLLITMTLLEAVNNIIVRFLKTTYNAREINYASGIAAFAASGVFVVFSLATGLMQGTAVLAALTSPVFLIGTFFLAFFGTFACGLLRGEMLLHMDTVKATIWYNVSTPISVAAGVLFLHETFRFYQLICTVLIVGCVLIMQLTKSKK